MESDIYNNKIKLCLIGEGYWGKQVHHVAGLMDRFGSISVINSSTPEEEKALLLHDATMLYIATPSDSQYEYVKYAIENDKFTVCESPFLKNAEERKEIYELINSIKPRFFHINSPYYMDPDLGRIVMQGMTKRSNFIYLQAEGPKFSEDIKKAKKFYSNQCLFIIFQIVQASRGQKISKFVVLNDNAGEVHFNDKVFTFKWSSSEYPILKFESHNDKDIYQKTIINDKYDNIFPMLKMITDQYYLFLPEYLARRSQSEINQFLNSRMLESYLVSSTAEHFSEIFSEHSSNEKLVIDDPLKLFLNGNFDLTYY